MLIQLLKLRVVKTTSKGLYRHFLRGVAGQKGGGVMFFWESPKCVGGKGRVLHLFVIPDVYFISFYPVKCFEKKVKSCKCLLLGVQGVELISWGVRQSSQSINTSIVQIAAVFSLFFIKKLLLDIVGRVLQFLSFLQQSKQSKETNNTGDGFVILFLYKMKYKIQLHQQYLNIFHTVPKDFFFHDFEKLFAHLRRGFSV